ncbi:MAG: hypothetical protein ABIO81_01250 [Ginsengibacter sp.]
MTNENKRNYVNHKPLTLKALNNLQKKGYKYLQIQGFTIDHHAEYVEPHYLMLVPMKELPIDQAKKDIYEPIDSGLINSWLETDTDNNGLEIYLAGKNYN